MASGWCSGIRPGNYNRRSEVDSGFWFPSTPRAEVMHGLTNLRIRFVKSTTYPLCSIWTFGPSNAEGPVVKFCSRSR